MSGMVFIFIVVALISGFTGFVCGFVAGRSSRTSPQIQPFVTSLPPAPAKVTVTEPTPQALANPPSDTHSAAILEAQQKVAKQIGRFVDRLSRTKPAERPPLPPDAPVALPRPLPQHPVTLKHMEGEEEISRKITVARKLHRIYFQGMAYDRTDDGVYWLSEGQGVRR